VLIIDRGRIVASGTPETLRQEMAQTPGLTVALKGELPEADVVIRQLPGVVRAARIGAGGETRVVLETTLGVDLREAIFREVVARNWTLLEMTPRQASLEDIFVRLVSAEDRPEADGEGNVDAAPTVETADQPGSEAH